MIHRPSTRPRRSPLSRTGMGADRSRSRGSCDRAARPAKLPGDPVDTPHQPNHPLDLISFVQGKVRTFFHRCNSSLAIAGALVLAHLTPCKSSTKLHFVFEAGPLQKRASCLLGCLIRQMQIALAGYSRQARIFSQYACRVSREGFFTGQTRFMPSFSQRGSTCMWK